MAYALSASLEDYLEAIFLIASAKGVARSKDIAEHLAVKGPSVTGALRLLAEKGLVNYAPYDVVTLTAAGRQQAESIVRRHDALQHFLTDVLLLDTATAEATACQLEHVIRGPVLDRLVDFVDFVKVCPRGGQQWIHGFAHYCRDGKRTHACEACIQQCLETYTASSHEEGGHASMSLPLTALQPGQKGTIVAIIAQGSLRRRMLDMGLTPGTLVEMERVAPLGDPVDVKVKGYHLSLRKEETACITVEPSA
ncbi:MAG: metal-dependent transcriptional regulator [Armatimonadota bacterium]